MRDRARRTESWQIAAPLTVGPSTLLPVERVVSHAGGGRAQVWYVVTKAPVAVVVRDAAGVRAIGTGDAAVSLEELRQRVPGLDAALMSD